MKALIVLVMAICLTACGKMSKSSPETVSPPNGSTSLRLIQTIPLQGVEGRIDHLSIDLKGQRLFVAALGNHTVEVVDLDTGKIARSISGFSEPQGIVFIPEFSRIFVADGGDGSCKIFDSNTLQMFDQ